MVLKVKIKLSDDTEKEFTVNTTVELPEGLDLTPSQSIAVLSGINTLNSIIKIKAWKTVELEVE